MKKTLLFLAISLASLSTLCAQNVHVGVGGGIPVGDSSETYSASVEATFSFLFDVNETFKVGPMASVHHYFGKEAGSGDNTFVYENVTFIPVGMEVRAKLSEKMYLGGEVAYGLGYSPAENGLFYKPFLGYKISESIGVVASFSRITSDSNNINSVNIGINLLTF